MGTIFNAINLLLLVVEFGIFVRVIISWIPVPRDNQFIQLLYQVTEPLLAPIRGLLERSSIGNNLMIDFSPWIAILIIEFLRRLF